VSIDLTTSDLVAEQPPRMALVMEMIDAAMHTMDQSLPDPLRQWWHGAFVGYQVGFGLISDSADVRFANCVYRTDPNEGNPALLLGKLAEHTHINSVDLADILHASGVQYGYKQSTSERRDATECPSCQKRICVDLDEWQHCNCQGDNYFCETTDCFHDFAHARSCEERFGEDI
jgi:hypothetical protein